MKASDKATEQVLYVSLDVFLRSSPCGNLFSKLQSKVYRSYIFNLLDVEDSRPPAAVILSR